MSPVTFRPAKRENVPLLVGIAGGTGSGKTFSAFRLARGLAGGDPFAVIDTESGRALHYADMFEFAYAALDAPFRPERYLEAIKAAEKAGHKVIVVDSMSHEWEGVGGMLEWQEEEFQRMGGRDAVKMTSWIKPKMAHRKFVSQLLQIKAHIILCFRAAEKVDMIRDEDGKMKVVPKQTLTGLNGWVPICEKTLPFELTISLLMTADAPGLPKPIKLQEQHRPLLPLDQPVGEETGKALGAWAAGGAAQAPQESDDARQLVSELLEAAELLGRRDKTTAAIAKNRRLHSSAPEKYVAWLQRQLASAQQALERARASETDDLFGDEAETTPQPQED